MALQALIFIVGIVLAVVGFVKRGTRGGKWLLGLGLAILFAGLVVVGYGDIKTGFFDALKD